MLFLLLVGLMVVDADVAMLKKAEMKTLIELANHHATFSIDQALKTEGIIEMVQPEAMDRFAVRMAENGSYSRQGDRYLPSSTSVTTDPVFIANYYVSFQDWRKDIRLSLRFNGNALLIEEADTGAEERPTGGELQVAVTTEKGQLLRIAPKKMIGPSNVVVAYVHERPLVPLLPAHSFPVVSVEELKW
ncbi:hypothetical protein G3578_14750 [Brevibacillus sp. SYP-B805]|nr:hypothetical protein [Brevibacillus sp. SYP-B805]